MRIHFSILGIVGALCCLNSVADIETTASFQTDKSAGTTAFSAAVGKTKSSAGYLADLDVVFDSGAVSMGVVRKFKAKRSNPGDQLVTLNATSGSDNTSQATLTTDGPVVTLTNTECSEMGDSAWTINNLPIPLGVNANTFAWREECVTGGGACPSTLANDNGYDSGSEMRIGLATYCGSGDRHCVEFRSVTSGSDYSTYAESVRGSCIVQ